MTNSDPGARRPAPARIVEGGHVGPIDAAQTPRWAGLGTFARLP